MPDIQFEMFANYFPSRFSILTLAKKFFGKYGSIPNKFFLKIFKNIDSSKKMGNTWLMFGCPGERISNFFFEFGKIVLSL